MINRRWETFHNMFRPKGTWTH